MRKIKADLWKHMLDFKYYEATGRQAEDDLDAYERWINNTPVEFFIDLITEIENL